MSKMGQFAKIYLKSGEVLAFGSLPSERLDIGFSGGFVTVDRGSQFHFKKATCDIDRIIFFTGHEGPDLELTVKTLEVGHGL